MKTYEDLVLAGQSEQARMEFVQEAVREHMASDGYRTAEIAEKYVRRQNVTISQYQKLLYTLAGQAVPDNYSANHKCKSGLFPYFITQENSYLLGNGVTFSEDNTKKKLGAGFDETIMQAGFWSLVHGCSYLFYNAEQCILFRYTEFAPLYSEENGALTAGVRFWQITADKPMRYTLYEPDGYTEYIKRKDEDMQVLRDKRPYKLLARISAADGTEIYGGMNYPSFPVVPLYGNKFHQSELVGLREKIDCYDLIESGFANDVDDASMIYWTINNAGGMDDIDLAKFVERIKTVRAAVVDDDGAKAEAHTIDAPYQARQAALQALKADMYEDAMALDVRQISAGNTTATQIIAAYEPLNNKADDFEVQVTTCILGLLAVAGVEDIPSYSRSKIVNQMEETQMVMLAAAHLDEETLLSKLPWLTPDDVAAVLDRREAEDFARFHGMGDDETLEDLNG